MTHIDGKLITYNSGPQPHAKTARLQLGLTLDQMADMLGYEGEHRRQMMHRVEVGERSLREPQRRLLEAYLHGYRPNDWPR